MLINTHEIADYQLIEQLHASSRTLVYRAICKSNLERVVIKILRAEYPFFDPTQS